METPLRTWYERIKVTGTPSVKLVEPTKYHKHEFYPTSTILILGPTGAGKSSFIEAFASNASLGISSNRLEGFTQSISAYQLINVKLVDRRVSLYPIYLVDVPGFSDTKISEKKILMMIKDWSEESRMGWFDRILYFMPINAPRLPGSQREVLRTFQALTGVETASGITVVTTMWDSLWSETAKQRGELNFEQLRNEFWKDDLGQGAEILKFDNTQGSALSILDHSLQRATLPDFKLQSLVDSKVHIRETSFARNIYQGLQTRCRNIHLELANIQSDLQGAAERDDEQLRGVLTPRQEEAQKLLVMFEQELQEFGDAPDPEPVVEETQLAGQPDTLSNHHDIETQDIPPAAASPHAQSVVAADDFGDEPGSSLVRSIESAAESPHTEQSPLHLTSTSPEDLPTAFQADAAPPASPHSPTSVIRLDRSRLLILKGLLRRLMQAAMHRGKKWFKKTKD